MSAFALHSFPERSGLLRWSMAAVAILLIHGLAVAAVVTWYDREPAEPSVIPAIIVSLASEASAPPAQEEADAVGPLTAQREDSPPPEPEKPEQQIEEAPPAPVPAEVALPKPQPEPVKREKPAEKLPPSEARAPPRSEGAAKAKVASSVAYTSLVFGHIQRFKRAAQNGGSGTAVVLFTLGRDGRLLGNSLSRSSGNAALDREALEIVRRANPFPPFPAEKTANRDSFTAPIQFGG